MFKVLPVLFIHSFIPLPCAECDDSLPFSGASSIPLCYVLFPATLLHQLFFHPLSPHLAIYFLVYLPILLFPNSHIIVTHGPFIHSFHCHVQNATIPCRSQELLPSLSVTYFFLPPFSTNYSSILSLLSSVSWSTAQSFCSQTSNFV